MWIVVQHVVATIFCAFMAKDDAIYDSGFSLIPHVPGMNPVFVDILTVLIPTYCLWKTREKEALITRATSFFCVLWQARTICICMTVLPVLYREKMTWTSLLFGGNGDYIFSGHTSFIASWMWTADLSLSTKYFLGILHAMCLLMTRMHYTIDIVIAWMLLYAWTRSSKAPGKMRLSFVKPSEYNRLGEIRERVFTEELGQYTSKTPEISKVVIGAFVDDIIVGYVALSETKKTPRFSYDTFDDAYEIRGLCVLPEYRRQRIGTTLLFAAVRYVDTLGRPIVASARKELVSWYVRYGFEPVISDTFMIGHVTYVPGYLETRGHQLDLDISALDWDLPFLCHKVISCEHGNGSMDDVSSHVIRADVLDAWYEPSPQVLDALTCDVGWTAKTSPPCHPHMLIEELADHRGVLPENIVFGAGSSDLMYRCLPRWLSKDSRVLLMTPTYAEYPHILKHVIRCHVDECSEDDFLHVSKDSYDAIICVNPNSPSGRYRTLEYLNSLPVTTLVWIDETYIDYVGPERSMESIAAESPNVVVCKSMSKVYALSGMRAAYLCGSPLRIDAIRQITPPWVLGRMTYNAVRAAIQSWEYYQKRLEETHVFRNVFASGLHSLGFSVKPGSVANFVLCEDPDAVELCEYAKARGIYLKLCDSTRIRITIQDLETNRKMYQTFKEFCTTRF